MGCLYYPRKQTSASAAAITDPNPDAFADCDFIVCYDNAKLADRHLASKVCCIMFNPLSAAAWCREQRMGSRGVLLLSRLTLPPSAGTTVGAREIKE